MNKLTTYTNLVLVALVIVLVSCQLTGNAQQVSFKTLAPTVLKKNGAEIFQYWELRKAAYLWDTNFEALPDLKAYTDSLANVLGRDTFNLTLQRISFQGTSFKSVKTDNPDSINTQLVHSKIVGLIRPINFLEAQLLNYQLSRYPLLSHPTEFHGFILMNDSLNLVRVYFAASDRPWPPKPAVILEAMKKDLKQGFTFKYHLHNHYEPKSDYYMGILAPSATDAQYYNFLSEDYSLEQALITNGFHTVVILRNEFPKLKTNSSR
jgi:hypothetical protein